MDKEFVIIGERINTSRKPIEKAVKTKDAGKIIKEAKLQLENKANFLDINCGSLVDTELDSMMWVLEKIFSKFKDVNVCIDSANPDVVEQVLPVCEGRKIIINSITAEPDRYKPILPLVKEKPVSIVALTIDSNGIPEGISDRLKIVENFLKIFKQYGVEKEKIYIDPLIRPLSSEPDQARKIISTIKEVGEKFDLKTIAGISNISYGLPGRISLNSFFLNLCIYNGLSAAIIDPTSNLIQEAMQSSYAISGKDEYCMEYIKAWRENKL